MSTEKFNGIKTSPTEKFNGIKTSLLAELQTEFGKLFAGINVEITSFVESKKKEISDHLDKIELTHSLNEIQKHGPMV